MKIPTLKTMKTKPGPKNEPKDAFDTMTSLNTLLRIFSLTAIIKDKHDLKVSWSFTKNLFLVTLFSCICLAYFILKLHYFNDNRGKKSHLYTAVFHVTYLLLFFQYLLDLYKVFKYRRETSLKSYKLYTHFDNVLGMAYYSEIKGKINRMTATFFVGGTVICLCEYIIWVIFDEWTKPSLYTIHYLLFLTNMLMELEVISYVIQIKYRLLTMGNVLQDFYSSSEKRPEMLEDLVNDKYWFYNFGKLTRDKVTFLKTLDIGRCYGVVWLHRCYLLLIEQVNYIHNNFGLSMLIYHTNLCLDMVYLLNNIIHIISTYLKDEECPLAPIVTCSARFTFCFVVLICLVSNCEQCIDRYRRIISSIDFILVDKNIDMETIATLRDLRALLLSRPVKFHVMDYYKLNYALIVSVITLVVTYTTLTFHDLS